MTDVRLTPDQDRLLALGNEVTKQLWVGRLDRGAILSKVPEEAAHEPLRPFASAFEQGLPPPPQGVTLKALPRLTRASGGLMGLWAVAGETGVGKTTFALQVALEYARHEAHSVLLYDYENGYEVTANHVGQALGSVAKARTRTAHWYYRDSIFSLNHDLGLCACSPDDKAAHGFTPKPALVVVDSLQALATDESAYHVLRRWLGVFERLARVGYHVLLLSEKPRYTYGRAKTSGFADVRAEYKAWFGVQLLEDRDGVLGVHVVKNRHRPYRGHLLSLRRDPGRVWAFEECAPMSRGREEDDEE